MLACIVITHFLVKIEKLLDGFIEVKSMMADKQGYFWNCIRPMAL